MSKKLHNTDRRKFAQLAQMLHAEESLPEGVQRVPSSAMTRVAKVDIAAETYFIKVFLVSRSSERLKQVFRGTRAERAKQASLVLESVGFLTPPVEVIGKTGSFSWMVTKAVPAVGLGSYFDAFFRGSLSSERLRWKRKVLYKLGELVGRLHAEGIAHGDLRPNNILIDKQSDEPRFYLIDNERNQRFSGSLPTRLVVKNLVQVALVYPAFGTRTDQFRFLSAYWRETPAAGSHNRLMRRVERRYRYRFSRLAQKPQSVDHPALEGVTNVP